MKKDDLIVDLLKDLKEESRVSDEAIKKEIAEIKSNIVEIQIDLRKNTDDMRYHIKRTDLLEDIIKFLKEQVESIKEKLTIGYLLKLIVTTSGGVAAITGAIYGIVKVIGILQG